MLRFTKITDYGMLLMAQLGKAEDGFVYSTSALTDATHVPAATVSKILQSLLNAGLLDSIRGARGGYRLARPASDISVRDIVSCLEGDIALTDCSTMDVACEQRSVCSTHQNWKRLNQAVHDVLANITLEDMVSEQFMPVLQLRRAMPISDMGAQA